MHYSPVCRSPEGALDLHVLSLPPAFVLSQDQTLMFRDLILALWSRLNRREHSHPPDQQNQPDDCNFLSKRDPPKSRTDPIPRRVPDPASLCRPRFSFFSIFNCQRSDVTDATSGPSAFRLRARSSVAHAALYDFSNKAEPQRRQRRAALVGEAYIGRTAAECQRPIPTFLNFLRHAFPRPEILVTRAVSANCCHSSHRHIRVEFDK